MHKKTAVICGESDLKPDFEAIGNNPNFVFENDPNFESLRLFDFDGNVVNVNSWLECANYVNGGWTNNISDFTNGEQILFFLFCSTIVLATYFQRKYKFLQRI
jgi:hypothetical protein|tara:strand:+ start:31 stop:339 length:309 start_codon:yes stop_codon:yes gene_type:complete